MTGDTLYRPILGDMMAAKFKVAPAAIFYILYIAGIVIFAVSKPHRFRPVGRRRFVRGALFGLFAYATYDLTNQATLKNWSTTITLADIGSGGITLDQRFRGGERLYDRPRNHKGGRSLGSGGSALALDLCKCV